MAKRVYKVTSDKGVNWLVRASTKTGALAYVGSKVLTSEVASQDDLIGMISAGMRVEEAGEAESAKVEE